MAACFRYTYGKSVEGNVTIKAHYPWPYYGAGEASEVQKMTMLDHSGEAVFRFANEELRQGRLINEFGYNQIKFTAVVTEKLTGQMRNGSAIVTVHKHPVKLVITRGADHFKPGLNYTFMVSILAFKFLLPKGIIAAKAQDDQPIPADATRKVYLNADFVIRSNQSVVNESDSETHIIAVPPYIPKREKYSRMLELDSNGTKVMNIETPSGALSLRIEVRYGSEDSSVYAYDYIDSVRSPSNNFAQLIPKQERIQLGKMLSFDIRTSSPVREFVALFLLRNNVFLPFKVISKGAIVHMSKIAMEDLRGTLEFEATAKMAPKSRVLVYGILPDSKEIIVDALDLKVDGAYTNSISLRINPSRVEPNTDVTFSINAPANSFVGLLVVDQSALLLKSANDINAGVIDNEIMSYEVVHFSTFPYPRPIMQRRRKRLICFKCGFSGITGSDPYSIFHSSNLIVFTDAFLYREPFTLGEFNQFESRFLPLFNKKEPPLAAIAGMQRTQDGVGAFGMPGSAGGATHAPRIRVRFPETWIWADLSTNERGNATHHALAPDTITSWVANAFSINEADGLKVAPNTEKLEVFRPFFIRLHLPYSVKRGEMIALQILIFNYMSNEKLVTVVLNRQRHSGFDFVNKPVKLEKDKEKMKLTNTRTVKAMPYGLAFRTFFHLRVKPRSSATVFIPIRPTTVGIIKLLVKAFADDAADAIEVPLIVEAEGFPVFYSRPLIINLQGKTTFSQSSLVETSADMVEDSGRAEVTIIGDVMGPTVKNAKGLIRMPYGCGEQNMINFVPNIIVMRYLKAVDKLTPELSAFGKTDSQGSTWLTAFVVRSFAMAKSYIFIDEEKLNASLKFLESQQKENGMFEENGDVLHKGLQGGSGQGGVPLTAFVFLALFENGIQNSEALNYLEQSLDHISNNSYALALVSYVLHRANSSKRNAAFNLLDNLATEKGMPIIFSDGFKYWTTNTSEEVSPNMQWYDKPRPADVEATAYTLLTYLLRDQTDLAFPIVRWLVYRRNALGGFSSTQDTVVALQALAHYAEHTYTPNTNLAITIRNGDHKALFQVNSDNAIVLQTYQINQMHQKIDISAEGKGAAFVQLNWRYNVKRLPNNKPFICEQKVVQRAPNELILSLCCRYNLGGKSNMAVLEMQTPSGFVIDSDQLSTLTSKEYLQRVETDKQDTQANIYFSSLNSDPICFNVSSQLAYQVSDQKPANIRLYDYYDPAKRIEFDYKVSKQVVIDDACGGDCWPEVSSAALISQSSSAMTQSIVSLHWIVLTVSLSIFLVRWL
ncbi:A macroglobulin complement component family [Trichuris trichiura]|uniref:A macroglobulin complement component family n=1 Tax=Trichuris trichiura TaxID=36087 RepID=A0A077Z549_TRITR|nr:A macroglobulin complement component family [Trichuris trichiura]